MNKIYLLFFIKQINFSYKEKTYKYICIGTSILLIYKIFQNNNNNNNCKNKIKLN